MPKQAAIAKATRPDIAHRRWPRRDPPRCSSTTAFWQLGGGIEPMAECVPRPSEACAQWARDAPASTCCSPLFKPPPLPVPPALPDPSLQALEAYYRGHRTALRGHFLRHGVRPDAAADLVQDTFARAVRAWPAFRGQSSLSTWLYGIARLALADHFRRLGRSPEDHAFSLDDAASCREGLEPQASGQADNPTEYGLAVRRALGRFANVHPDRAEVLALVTLNHWTSEELGQWLGRTPHAAAEYLSQCRRLLREQVQVEWPQCDEA